MKILKRIMGVAALAALLTTSSGIEAGALGLGKYGAKQPVKMPGKAFSKGTQGPSLLQILLPIAIVIGIMAYFSGSDDESSASH